MDKFFEVLAKGKGIFKKVAIGGAALTAVAILVGMMREPVGSDGETCDEAEYTEEGPYQEVQE